MTETISTAPRPLEKRTAGNENTGLIKVFAILFMVIDHVGVAFFPRMLELRVLGRIAFPLFAWCLCVGAEYTRSPVKYGLRLLIVGVLSQPIYMFAMNHTWDSLNIFFELLLGLLAVCAIRENKWGSRYWGPLLVLALSCALKLNNSYGWKGLVFIMALYLCRNSRGSLAAVMAAFCLYWGQGTARVTSVLGLKLPQEIPFLPEAAGLLSDLSRIQFWAVLALPLILLPMKGRLRLPKWVSYAAYPAHLAVIGVIRHWDQVSALLSRWL